MLIERTDSVTGITTILCIVTTTIAIAAIITIISDSKDLCFDNDTITYQ
jgi:hypothetical protein